ncbi:bifunctional [glutamate--ammonia ligase]-adenylyl-L-tyrosine phosphorylase/[glutamate--ammonia-ligase] adenylyltransferase [Sphingomonas nostoxanthinifaciens]|uniref:bifunctional [glutamate--ammonia ligase]-adenylyl-L-tyrosine phosphorylase/[glutamate--ammonia-ligase] adenylyltransferase n=1 Tax=Sphingomonas nostoxanthinifaciens TaxID=2872652 RepID=UPI001CC1D650|nr:bifunctional [glutamate--ammonia ligase]-adenylyl-L-tyrosine phosphorylase/[glutamate--ammonia-ligase] adenylyltransferase [Sphingomonas nostoxanthinifaciens]UAK24247.1 bifunctional [glutamate--ammonia ligase]-adenylyl-L-tyrosine phosphorylase/[glutamate--ammonia-ligase] adenylyltransferase [Sphingomonas nostoxanthinifaciens]
MQVTGDIPDPAALDRAIARASATSPFLRGLIVRRGAIVERLAADGLISTLAEARAESASDSDIAHALRRERQAVALAVALADLAGASFETVTHALSDFADHALDRAISAAIAERTPGEAARGFVALALGKQGSRELNYSSDIDPILLFDPATLPRRARDDPAEAAVRIARRVVALLQERTADGYVLRVDLRLRPASEATPLAVPLGLAITHYESSALPWERAAFIRARAAAGDIVMGENFLAHIRPFVWRRALDYGAIREMRALTARIRDHHAQSQRPGPGYDLKRGRGGIREVEFFAQVHQLIHGGRMPSIRLPATLDVLPALAQAGFVAPEEASSLAEAYRVLRTIEHRLQMIDDRQTHRLPEDPLALDAVARLADLGDGDALVARLAPHIDRVGRAYDALEQDTPTGLPQATEGLDAALHASGFRDPAAARVRLADWREGRTRTTRSAAARAALEPMLPGLIAALGRAPDPDAALAQLDELVRRLPSAVNLFRLLEARPAIADQLVAILAHAPALAEELRRRASLLDGLIDASALTPPPDVATLSAAFAQAGAGGDYQAMLDGVRFAVGERRFQLGLQLIAGHADPLDVGAGYARVAEAAVETLAQATVADFERANGRIPGGELVILALGRLGGGVLTHASDLDLIYLFTGDFLAESDGARPIGATTYFNRLAQRVTAALSVPTAAGPLYPVDTRLRPSGNQGLLAVSLDSFDRYEAESAWTWEHMALTRARPIFGAASARDAAQAAIDRTLTRRHDPATLAADAIKMRGDIATHKPPAGPFDVKLIDGGLVDAEFAVHLLQLRDGVGLDPHLGVAAAALEAAGLIAAGFAEAAALLARMLVTLRLVSPTSQVPAEPSRALVAQASGARDWADLLARYDAARALIHGEWRRVAGLG